MNSRFQPPPWLGIAGKLLLGFSAWPTLPAFAATLHVWPDNPNPSPPYATWATAATDLQRAVDAALAGDTVLATNGVYRVGSVELNGRNRLGLRKALTVRSVNGPAATVIEGAVDGVRCAYVGNGAVLSGFKLTGGAARGDWVAGSRGGAWCEDGGVLTNCLITGNSAAHRGGGVLGGKLYRCTLTENSVRFVMPDGGRARPGRRVFGWRSSVLRHEPQPRRSGGWWGGRRDASGLPVG